MDNHNKHKNMNRLVLVFLLFSFIMVIPFSSGVNDLDKIPNKLDIKETHKLFSSERTYENDFVKIKSHKNNKIDLTNSIFNDKYISIDSYDKGNQDIDFEISFYTDNDNVSYDIYKSDDVFISKSKVKEIGQKYTSAYSKDGYVNFTVKGFSSYILTIPDFVVPFHNIVSLDMRQYYDDPTIDHFYYTFFDEPDIEGSNPWIIVDDYESYISHRAGSLNTDTFEITAYKVGGNSFLDLYTYTSLCSSELTPIDDTTDCYYLGVDTDTGIGPLSFNEITVWACNATGTVTQTFLDPVWNLGGSGCTLEDSFFLNTPSYERYYLSQIESGLHEDMNEYYSFNEFFHEEPDSEFNGRYTNVIGGSGATYTTVNEFKAGGYEGGAFVFDGTDDYILLNGDEIGYNDFSVSGWFYSDITANGILFSGRSTFSSNPIVNIYTLTDGQISFRIRSNTGSGITSLDSVVIPTLNTWNFFTITFDQSTGEQTLYLNDETPKTVIYSGGDFSNIDVLSMGGQYITSASGFYDGRVDEVGFYTKVLSSDEVDYIYNSGNGRDFFNLNTPAPSYFSSGTELTFDVGTSSIYLSNLFNWDTVGGMYDYSFYYYDYVTEQFETLPEGFGSVASEGYRFDNGLGILDVEYFGLEVEQRFDGDITAIDTLTGKTYTQSLTFIFPAVLSITPPYQIKPLTSTYDGNIDGDIPGNVNYNINSHYGNYTTVYVSYLDDVNGDGSATLQELTNTIYTGNSNNSLGNLSVQLYSENANVFLNISSVDGKYYDDSLFIRVYNSAGELNETINIISNTPQNLQFLSIPDFEVGVDGELIIDFNNYFYNITDVTITYVNQLNETEILNNALPCDNISCPLMQEGINKNTYDDYIIGVNGEFNLIFASIQNLLNISVTVNVSDNSSGSGIDTFNISILESVSGGAEEEYFNNWKQSLYGLFPDDADLSTFQKGLFVVISLFLLGFIIILLMRKFDHRLIILALVVMSILVFLLYASINYISIATIIIVTLIIGTLLFFKVRNI